MIQKILLFVKNNFTAILVIGLIIIVMLQRCEKEPVESYTKEDTGTIKIDTVWAKTSNTFITKPIIYKTTPGNTDGFIPDSSYSKLVEQYQALVKAYVANNSYKDSIKIDSIGYINIQDEVSHNTLKDRKTSYSLKYPIITNTITLPPTKKNQLYYGGGLEYKPLVGEEINLGILLKTKSDQIYNIYGGVDSRGNYQVGVQSYWKISFKKQK